MCVKPYVAAAALSISVRGIRGKKVTVRVTTANIDREGGEALESERQ